MSTLSNLMDCSLPGSSAHGIFQARVLEWGAIKPLQIFSFHWSPTWGILFPGDILSSVHSLSHVQLFATPWTSAHQASLYITSSQSLFKLMSIEYSVIPFSSCLQSFSASGSFPMSLLFASGGQSIGASTSVLPMKFRVDFL